MKKTYKQINIKLNNYIKVFWEGILNSYAQIFFSNNKMFGFILLVVSFFDIGAGLSGVIAILIGQILAIILDLNIDLVKDGTYTYNSAMLGIGIGMLYEFNFSFFVLLFFASILVFFLTIWFLNNLFRKSLPLLSISFLLAIWIVILSSHNFSALALRQKETLSMAKWFPEIFTNITNFITRLPFADAIYLYLRSLGAILFQYNDLAGLIIAFALLINSRISFVLSIFGFLIGYFFYSFLQGDFSQLIYSYIGFNFILTAIALGGFFIVPSRQSFLFLLLAIPTIALLISGFHSIFTLIKLPLYSLPFNIIVWLFLTLMFVRTNAKNLQLVKIQQFSLEKNHYKYFNAIERFKKEVYFHISLPFMGEWMVSQGYDGEITHKGEWKHALDFVVVDDVKKTFKGMGIDLQDYYCYDLPVLAPASGYVVKIIDGVNDNKIGEVDLENNWGNTIIIKHSEYLYSKLSHLKKNTFQVKENDYVIKGDILAYSGSSGRSPEPHLHFQLQTTPFVGSKTIEYPIDYYLTKYDDKYKFHSFEIPKENEIVSNVKTEKLLLDVFAFIPGKVIEFEVEKNGKKKIVKWEVFVTALNKTYIYSHTSQSTAYFVNNGTVFYFTDFYGDKKSFLHYFYLGFHKVLLGYYKEIEIKDKLLISNIFKTYWVFIHDFVAPFYHYLKADYQIKFISADTEHNPSEIKMKSVCKGIFYKKEVSKISFTTHLENGIFKEILIEDNQNKITAIQIK